MRKSYIMNQLPRLKIYKLQYTIYLLFLINNLRLYQKLYKKLDRDFNQPFFFCDDFVNETRSFHS